MHFCQAHARTHLPVTIYYAYILTMHHRESIKVDQSRLSMQFMTARMRFQPPPQI